MQVVGVRFQPLGKIYYFDASGIDDVRVGDYIVVEVSRHLEIARVVTLQARGDVKARPIKAVKRRATPQDLMWHQHYRSKERETILACRLKSAELGLFVKIVKSDYSLDGRRLTVHYLTGEGEEPDVSALQKALAEQFQLRVEMRKIGVRDASQILAGLGLCGDVRCCAQHLCGFPPISIRMAKEQGLSLNQADIIGLCGRLRCCLRYEAETYRAIKAEMPKIGAPILTTEGSGKVVDHDVVREMAMVELEGGMTRPVPLDVWKTTPAGSPCATCPRQAE